MRPNVFRSQTGFTLVELLVVIGIITLLIAILFPVLAAAKKQVRRAQCQANLHSIGHALTIYVQQNRCYPACTLLDQRGATRWGLWPLRLRSAMGGEQRVFNCPAQDERCEWTKEELPPGAQRVPMELAGPEHTNFGYEAGEALIDNWGRWFSYGYNVWGASAATVPPPFDAHKGLGPYISIAGVNSSATELRAARVKVPSKLIAVTDSSADGHWDIAVLPLPDVPRAWPGRVHAGGANVLFCDGHVEWFTQTDLLVTDGVNPSQALIRRMWNNDHEPNW